VLLGVLAERKVGRLGLFVKSENLLNARQTRDDPLVLPVRRPDGRWDADRDLLGLALRQLLDNAVKYSPSTSTIEIAAIGNGAVDIAVRNTGPAIPEREQVRIVERFYRGTHARHVPGTGIGLAIVQQIARAHGGSLTVSSTAEAGTAFTLSLPRGELTT
jgi:signal transduction histidine kinase